jgi:hypothetical protein
MGDWQDCGGDQTVEVSDLLADLAADLVVTPLGTEMSAATQYLGVAG